MKGIITRQGIAAAIQSEADGYVTKIKLTTYAIGDGAGIEPTGNETNVYGNVVKSGNIADDMTVLRAGDNLLVYKMTMGTDIGNFDVGNVGLFDENGNLFALLVYSQVRPKVAVSPPQEPGNILRIQMGLVFANIASAVDVSFIDSATADLPTVATEIDLPSASVAPHNLYIVQNSSSVGGPAFAYTDGVSWTFTPLTGSTVTAVAVAVTPAGGISATNVQAALQELDNEKAPKNSPQLLGTPEAPTAAPGTSTNQIATTEFVSEELSAFDAPADGIIYGRKDNAWELIPGANPIGLDDLTDVDVTATPPTDGQALVYDQTNDVWVPGSVSGGGGIPEASDSSIRSGTGTDYISARRAATAQNFVTLGSTGTVTIDLNAGINFFINATGNITLANPSSGLVANKSGIIVFKNNSFSITYGTNWLFPGGIKPNPAPNTKNAIAYIVDPDLNILCTFIENFA